jgi:predicted neuraminidase
MLLRWFCILSFLFVIHLPLSRAQLVSGSLIFPEQEKHVHGSSLVSLPSGDLLCVWFYGSGERTSDDVKLMGARLPKGSLSWSEPFLMADTPQLPDCNPVLFLNQSGKLFLVWIAVQANLWEQSILKVRTSTDYQKPGPPVWLWQDNILLKPTDAFAQEIKDKLKDLPAHGIGWAGYAPKYDEMILSAAKDPAKRSIGWMTRIKPLLIGEKKIILPLYSDGFNLSITAISDDQGESWRPGLPIVGRGPIQPALILRKNGDILALMRDSGDEPPRVQKSISRDQGESWSAAVKTPIPNTASVELLSLKDGRIAFVGNDLYEGRHRLQLYLSGDEGETWYLKIPLEEAAPGKGSFSYPSLIQSADGMIHISYSYHRESARKSIKHLMLDPSKWP